jgi:predicted site-specific integrase-resolvase
MVGMKLSVWAKHQGIAYKTAWRMWKLGQLPVPAEQLPTDTIIVHQPVTDIDGGTALYARVSSVDQRILRNPAVHTVVVEHRDRLMRFGVEYVEAALAAQGRSLWLSSRMK